MGAAAPSLVTVFRFDVVEYQPPMVTVEVDVSAGTYVRALVRDLGEQLETGAHTVELRRLAIGPWNVEDAVPLAGLAGTEPLLPPLALLDGLPVVELDADELVMVRVGRDVARPGASAAEAALTHAGRLVAVGTATSLGWHPTVVLPEAEPA